MAMATSAELRVSPEDSRASYSRGAGFEVRSAEREMRSSVRFAGAETVITTAYPPALALTARSAITNIFSGSAREVPPNFMTIICISNRLMAKGIKWI
jgi:hypothetical protein